MPWGWGSRVEGKCKEVLDPFFWCSELGGEMTNIYIYKHTLNKTRPHKLQMRGSDRTCFGS